MKIEEIESILCNVRAIDPNKNNISMFNINRNKESNSYFENFTEIEKTEVNKKIKNKKKRINYFLREMNQIFRKNLIPLYKNRETINEMGHEFNAINILHSILVKKELPQIPLKFSGIDYTSKEVCFFIISNYFFNHRGLNTKRTEIKLDINSKKTIKLLNEEDKNKLSKGSLEKTILEIPKNEEDKNIHNLVILRNSFCNKLINGEKTFFITMSDNKELYEFLLNFMKIKKVKHISNNLFWLKNQKNKKYNKRAKCSFLKNQIRGDKDHPYQELMTSHIQLNISNIDLDENSKNYENKFINNLKKSNGFISNILIKILKFKPMFINGQFILNKNKIKFETKDIIELYENMTNKLEKQKELNSIGKLKFNQDELNSIYEYYEEEKSHISNTSNIYAKLYIENLFKYGLIITTNKLNLLSINTHYKGNFESEINKLNIIDKKDLYKKLNVKTVCVADKISNRNFNYNKNHTKNRIKKEYDKYIDTVFKKKWTDPNILQKCNLMYKKILDDLWINDKVKFESNLNKLRQEKIIIESTRVKLNDSEKEKHILRSLYGSILTEICGKKKINKLLFETNNIDIYDGENIDSNNNLQVDHIIPKSTRNEYGNFYENLVVTKEYLNSKKGDELPLSSNLQLNTKDFKNRVKNIYSNSLIRIITEIKNIIKNNHSGIFIGINGEYALKDDLFLYKSKKGGWIKTKSNIENHLKKYFDEKKKILILDESKDSIECEFDSKTLTKISHTTMAFKDCLIEIFGIKEENIIFTPRKFSYIGLMRKLLNRIKDRNFNTHHIEDCVLLSFLKKRNVNGRKSIFNDKQDVYNYFKKIYNIDLKNDSDIRKLNDYLDKICDDIDFKNKTIRSFEKKTINDISTKTPRKKFHEDTIRSCKLENGNVIKTKIKKVSFIDNKGQLKEFGTKDCNHIKKIQIKSGVDIAFYEKGKVRKVYENITNWNVTKEETKTDTLYYKKKPNKNGILPAKNKTRDALFCLYELPNGKYSLLNNFEKDKSKSSNFVIKKGYTYEVKDLTITFKNKKYILNGKFIIKAINGGYIKLTNVNTNLVLNEKSERTDNDPYLYYEQLTNNIAFRISYKEFHNKIKSKHLKKY